MSEEQRQTVLNSLILPGFLWLNGVPKLADVRRIYGGSCREEPLLEEPPQASSSTLKDVGMGLAALLALCLFVLVPLTRSLACGSAPTAGASVGATR